MYEDSWKNARMEELRAELESNYESNESDWYNLSVFEPQPPADDRHFDLGVAA
jgi:hypothetical protein